MLWKKLGVAGCMSLHIVPSSFGQLIVLYSGEVFRGTWNKMEVALKVLKTDAGISPSSEVRPSANVTMYIILLTSRSRFVRRLT